MQFCFGSCLQQKRTSLNEWKTTLFLDFAPQEIEPVLRKISFGHPGFAVAEVAKVVASTPLIRKTTSRPLSKVISRRWEAGIQANRTAAKVKLNKNKIHYLDKQPRKYHQ